MKYSPPIQRGRATFFATLFFALAILSYIFSLTGLTPPLVFQIVTLVTASAAVYVTVRYLFTSVTYILRVNGEHTSLDTAPRDAVDFVVMKAQGRREAACECMISLKYLTRVETYTDALASSLRREYKSPKFYHYTVSVKPDERQLLVFEDEYDVNCIVVEMDGGMKRYLESKLRDTGFDPGASV